EETTPSQSVVTIIEMTSWWLSRRLSFFMIFARVVLVGGRFGPASDSLAFVRKQTLLAGLSQSLFGRIEETLFEDPELSQSTISKPKFESILRLNAKRIDQGPGFTAAER